MQRSMRDKGTPQRPRQRGVRQEQWKPQGEPGRGAKGAEGKGR